MKVTSKKFTILILNRLSREHETMSIKKTITEQQFINEFMSIRPDNFCYDSLRRLYEFYDEVYYDTDMELDVIAICCDWTEYDNYYQAVQEYGTDCYDTLEDNTIVLMDDPAKPVVVANY